MRTDPHALRILGELSTLLGRDLQFANGSTRSASAPRVEIAPGDGAALGTTERRLVNEIAELLQRNSSLRSEHAALDQRLRAVEQENMELRAKNRALSEQSSRDAMTGLFKRWYMVDTIEAEMNRALRSGSSVAVLMLDIDHLSRINAEHGSETGDLVIQRVAQLLRESCRGYDVPARFGGEEFCLMLPQTPLESTVRVAERLRAKIESAQIDGRNGSLSVTSSIGVASLENIPDEAVLGASSLIERAERALATAKTHGCNRVETWTAALASRRALETSH